MNKCPVCGSHPAKSAVRCEECGLLLRPEKAEAVHCPCCYTAYERLPTRCGACGIVLPLLTGKPTVEAAFGKMVETYRQESWYPKLRESYHAKPKPEQSPQTKAGTVPRNPFVESNQMQALSKVVTQRLIDAGLAPQQDIQFPFPARPLMGMPCQGELSNDKMDGIGRLTYKDGTVREGTFQELLLHGPGRVISPDGTVWEGMFERGQMKGPGAQRYAGAVYAGIFHNGKLHGAGRKIFSDGRMESGDYQNGKLVRFRHVADWELVCVRSDSVFSPEQSFAQKLIDAGHAPRRNVKYETSRSPSGNSIYEGDLARDCLNGEGLMRFKDGAVWEGIFRDMLLEGPGRMIFTNGTVWEGIFHEGRMLGLGVQTNQFAVCEGVFNDNKLHGPGRMVYCGTPAMTISGIYQKGELVQARPVSDWELIAMYPFVPPLSTRADHKRELARQLASVLDGAVKKMLGRQVNHFFQKP